MEREPLLFLCTPSSTKSRTPPVSRRTVYISSLLGAPNGYRIFSGPLVGRETPSEHPPPFSVRGEDPESTNLVWVGHSCRCGARTKGPGRTETTPPRSTERLKRILFVPHLSLQGTRVCGSWETEVVEGVRPRDVQERGGV